MQQLTNITYTYKEHILKLRDVIYKNLDPLINDNYCLLDIPDHNNIGDNLIWAGELAYLKRLPYTMKYSANFNLCQFNKIGATDIILLHGGGNFGDVWRRFQEFKIDIVQKFKKNRIILLPQTVHYSDQEFLVQDAAIFNSHPDITICARDKQSYNILKTYCTKANILLTPDMAFCFDVSAPFNSHSNKILILKRVDKELNTNFDLNCLLKIINTPKAAEVKDWPTFNYPPFVRKTKYYAGRAGIKMSTLFLKSRALEGFVDHNHGFKSKYNRDRYIKTGIDFIADFDEVYSTRLHGYILAFLMGKKAYMLDNSYGKNKNFFNTWMKEFEGTSLIENNHHA
jgi:exopolysaccharide biosynthesis predicted pyruvyltransferase EpsI